MRLPSILTLALACLPLISASAGSASASGTAVLKIRVVSAGWLEKNDVRLLSAPRNGQGTSRGLVNENGQAYLLVELNGNSLKFEVPQGTVSPEGPVHVSYVPVFEGGHQRLIALSLNGRNLGRLP